MGSKEDEEINSISINSPQKYHSTLLSRSRDDAKLQQQREHIGKTVLADNLAVAELVDIHGSDANTLARSRNAHQRPFKYFFCSTKANTHPFCCIRGCYGGIAVNHKKNSPVVYTELYTTLYTELFLQCFIYLENIAGCF